MKIYERGFGHFARYRVEYQRLHLWVNRTAFIISPWYTGFQEAMSTRVFAEKPRRHLWTPVVIPNITHASRRYSGNVNMESGLQNCNLLGFLLWPHVRRVRVQNGLERLLRFQLFWSDNIYFWYLTFQKRFSLTSDLRGLIRRSWYTPIFKRFRAGFGFNFDRQYRPLRVAISA